MVSLLIGSALLVGIGALVESLKPYSKGWASREEQEAFEWQREKWRQAFPVYP